MYEHYVKRCLDVLLSLCALIILSPVFVILSVIGTINMKGNPFFTQARPGKDEAIFKMIKFRSMTTEKDARGQLLPDEKRLTKYGKVLRATSLDEIPELINILKGEMSIVGPRPQLVRDMVFMTPDQRRRHSVRPGLTGLAQVNGRNAIDWEKKLSYDQEYIERITFLGDCKLILLTALKVLKKEGIQEEGHATATDYGEYLLSQGKITKQYFEEKINEATKLIKD